MPRRSCLAQLRYALRLALGCLAAGLALSSRADEAQAPKPAPDAVPFAAWVEHGEFIGDEQLRRLFVTSGSNQLGMLVPTGLRADLSRADRVTLTAPDLSYYLSLKIIGSGVPGLGSGVSGLGAGESGLRQLVLQLFPGAALTEESSLEIAGSRGPLFRLRWQPADNVDRLVTVTFVSSAAGWLEFAVVADRLKADEAQNALTGMLARLQSGERGRLKMVTFRQPDYN